MAYTRIKICGLTRIDDAVAAARAGVDAVGLVFHAPSPRCIDVATAAAIVRAVGPFVTTVALFVNVPPVRVREIMAATGIQLLQFHGDEDAAYCGQFARPYVKAIRMAPGLDPQAEMARFPGALGYLFDAWRIDQYGGTGEVFDWRRFGMASVANCILAGGLTPDNVAAAMAIARPAAVDVSGGVESAPGIKDHGLIARFVAAVRGTAYSDRV